MIQWHCNSADICLLQNIQTMHKGKKKKKKENGCPLVCNLLYDLSVKVSNSTNFRARISVTIKTELSETYMNLAFSGYYSVPRDLAFSGYHSVPRDLAFSGYYSVPRDLAFSGYYSVPRDGLGLVWFIVISWRTVLSSALVVFVLAWNMIERGLRRPSVQTKDY